MVSLGAMHMLGMWRLTLQFLKPGTTAKMFPNKNLIMAGSRVEVGVQHVVS